jgi:succinate dehydrogenase / fumarate reductase cytochrome b subunit
MSALAPPTTKVRRQFRNIQVGEILKYRLPAAGIVSIMHRISGAALFLFLPLLLWLFDLSLISELSFVRLREVGGQWWMKLILLGLAWALLHHLIAGVRYLALDLHIGIDKEPSARTARWVYYISLPLTFIVALRLFGAF